MHAGHGQELELVEYLYRVLFSMIVIVGVGTVVFWGLEVVNTIRSRV